MTLALGADEVDGGVDSTLVEDARLQASSASELVGGTEKASRTFTLGGSAEARTR